MSDRRNLQDELMKLCEEQRQIQDRVLPREADALCNAKKRVAASEGNLATCREEHREQLTRELEDDRARVRSIEGSIARYEAKVLDLGKLIEEKRDAIKELSDKVAA